MIVCSCSVVTERDIDLAVFEILTSSTPLIPTPGVVFRQLNKKMNCCGCAPVAVSMIYEAMDRLSGKNIAPFTIAMAKEKLARIKQRYEQRERPIVRRAA